VGRWSLSEYMHGVSYVYADDNLVIAVQQLGDVACGKLVYLHHIKVLTLLEYTCLHHRSEDYLYLHACISFGSQDLAFD
jgi:hypothetical protein